MIIDTSAIIAILRDEPEAQFCAMAIENTGADLILPLSNGVSYSSNRGVMRTVSTLIACRKAGTVAKR